MLSSATKQFISQHRFDDVTRLALSSQIYANSDVDVPFAIVQISGRQAIKDKIPSWAEADDLLYPPKLSLEQCSSETTARYKASLLKGNSFVDLTGGFGVDCAYLSKKIPTATYVERQSELCTIVRHNFSILGLNHVTIVNDQAGHFLESMEPSDCTYIDPSRRSDTGRKTVAISDCEPDVSQMRELLLKKSECILIKFSPMLDISLALRSLPETSDVHVVSVENECKELLFLMKKNWGGEALIHSVNFKKNQLYSSFSFQRIQEKEAIAKYTLEVKNFLYEPDSSLLKAGAYKLIASQFHLYKLHPDSHLYTSSKLISDFPGRCFEVQIVSSFNKSELKTALLNCKQANVAIRNFPASVEELRRKLRIKDGGSDYLFATTLSNDKRVIIIGKKVY